MIPKMKSVAQLLSAGAALGMVANRFHQPANQLMLDWAVPGTTIRAALVFFVDDSGPSFPVPIVMYPADDPSGVWESTKANAEEPPSTLGRLLARLRDLVLEHAGDGSAADVARWENQTLHLFNKLWLDAGVSSPPLVEIQLQAQIEHHNDLSVNAIGNLTPGLRAALHALVGGAQILYKWGRWEAYKEVSGKPVPLGVSLSTEQMTLLVDAVPAISLQRQPGPGQAFGFAWLPARHREECAEQLTLTMGTQALKSSPQEESCWPAELDVPRLRERMVA